MSESLDQEIRTLRAQFWSARDPEGRAFAPLAEAYRQLGDLEEAASLVHDGLDRLPDFASGHLVASRVARDCGDLLAAREHLDRVLDLDPENVLALLERADARASEADGEGAALDLRAALEAEPGNEAATRRLADLEDTRWSALVTDESAATPETAREPEEEPTIPSTMEPSTTQSDVSEAAEVEEVGETDADPFANEEEEEDAFLTTRTMAELYARQGLHERALEVYAHLVEAHPDDTGLAERVHELRNRADESEESPADEPEEIEIEVGEFEEIGREEEAAGPAAREVNPPAITPPTPRPGPPGTIAGYLGDLLAWVPGAIPVADLAPEGLRGASRPPTPALSQEDPSAEGAPEEVGGEGDKDDFDAWLRSLRS